MQDVKCLSTTSVCKGELQLKEQEEEGKKKVSKAMKAYLKRAKEHGKRKS